MKLSIIAPLIVLLFAMAKPFVGPEKDDKVEKVEKDANYTFVIDTMIPGDYPEETVYFDGDMRFSYDTGFNIGDTLLIRVD